MVWGFTRPITKTISQQFRKAVFRGSVTFIFTLQYTIKPETTRLETGQKKTHVLIGSNQPAKNRRCVARACACMIIHSFIQVNQVVVDGRSEWCNNFSIWEATSDRPMLCLVTQFTTMSRIACSGTLYFLFKIRWAVVTQIRGGFTDLQRNRVGVGEEENNFSFSRSALALARLLRSRARRSFRRPGSKRTKSKIKQRLCTGKSHNGTHYGSW